MVLVLLLAVWLLFSVAPPALLAVPARRPRVLVVSPPRLHQSLQYPNLEQLF